MEFYNPSGLDEYIIGTLTALLICLIVGTIIWLILEFFIVIFKSLGSLLFSRDSNKNQ